VQEQAAAHGAQFEMAEVEALEPLGDGGWRVVTGAGAYMARAVIVASGSKPKPLGVPGEERLEGRGISHCATCDGPLFRGKTVGVVGGGSAALQEALTLAGHVGRVLVFTQDAAFTGQETYRRRVAEQPKIEARHGVTVVEVLGDSAVTGVRLRDAATGGEQQMELSALFVYAGGVPNTAFLRGVLPLADDGRVPVDGWMRAERPGLFAAGDVRADSPGHAITAAGEGATAAIAAHKYLPDIGR
jgi:thioredoxin reductase (NADPH)